MLKILNKIILGSFFRFHIFKYYKTNIQRVKFKKGEKMGRRAHGFRRRTRNKLRKSPGDKNTVNQFLEEFDDGENVVLKIEPSSHKAMPHPRFKGKIGIVTGMRGRSYLVEIKDGGMKKTIITKSEHLRHLNK